MTYKRLRFIILLPIRLLVLPVYILFAFLLASDEQEFKEVLLNMWE